MISRPTLRFTDCRTALPPPRNLSCDWLRVGRFGLVLRVLLLMAFGSYHKVQAQNAGPADRVFASEQVMQQIAAIGREKESWTPQQRKIAPKLLLETKKRLRRPMANGIPEMRSTVELDPRERALVDIQAEVSDDLLRQIERLGGQVINRFARYRAIRALVPLAQMEALAEVGAVRSIRPADRTILHKNNTSEGVVAHRVDNARTTYGVDGTGVRVGVISDSVESLDVLQASGDLPAGITVIPGQASSGTSEGTAMLEIVYDVAPGASLFFATANGGQAQFAQNILDLRAAGCQVIVDDVGYFAEPVFQDGVIAQAVETVIADGAVYFSAAGNEGNLNDGTSGVWEGDFVATAAPAPLAGKTAHNFGGGLNYNRVTVDPPMLITLQWSDPFDASSNDYDLYLLNSTRTVIFDASVGVQNGTQDPFEAIDSSTFNDAGNVLVIVRHAGVGRFLHLNTHRGRLEIATAGQTSGHSAAASAFSVAAVNAATAGGGAFVGGSANPVELFSSDGPRRIFYDVNGSAITPGNVSSTGGTLRSKPDIAAADGVSTATPGFASFFGTSAAAPHAAGIAALMIANGLGTPSQIRQAFTATAMDIEAVGLDRDSGAGIVNALAAVGHGFVPTVVSVTATDATASEPGGGQGGGVFTLNRTGSTAAGLTVNFSVSGMASSPSDYAAVGTSATFGAGSAMATASVTVNDDSLVEGNETVVMTLAAGTGYTVGTPSSATVTIQDDDASACTSANLVTGMTLGPVLNNYTGWQGMRLRVGNQPLQVQSLGRVFVNGNSGNHELRLVAVTGVATVASVVWTPTGGVQNQIKYAALTAPVTLSANTDYYLASQEVSGGDQWYRFTTVVTTTSAASVLSAAYSGNGSSWGAVGSAGNTYGPVSLQYCESGGTQLAVARTSAAPSTPRLIRMMAPGQGTIQLKVSGRVGEQYEILASEDLQTWKVLHDATLDEEGWVEFTDSDAGNYPSWFYRTVLR